jgi:hypothetical protein
MLLQHFVTKRKRGVQIFLNFNNVLSFAFVNPPLLLYTGKACKGPVPVLMAKRGGTSTSLWGLV